MKYFLITKEKDNPKIGSIQYSEKEALDRIDYLNGVGLNKCIAKEFAYKPEPKDIEVSWVVYYTILGTEFSEVFKTRRMARLEKKFIQDNLEHFVEKPYNIYIQREEVWVVDKKKVS